MSKENGSSNGRAANEDRVRVAIIGIGNCANSLLGKRSGSGARGGVLNTKAKSTAACRAMAKVNCAWYGW